MMSKIIERIEIVSLVSDLVYRDCHVRVIYSDVYDLVYTDCHIRVICNNVKNYRAYRDCHISL